jgi:hypothetical protein
VPPSDSSSFEIPATVLFREVDGQMVLLNLESEQYYGLNAVGADIVTRLTSQPYLAAFSALARDYDVDPEVLQRDVDDLVRSLERAGLLRRVDPAS